MMVDALILQANNICKNYEIKKRLFKNNVVFRAVDKVSFEIQKGETLGLAGESGCGKSTLAKILAGIIKLSSGSVIFEKQEITRLSKRRLRKMRLRIQLIQQNPFNSFNPRKKLLYSLKEGVEEHGIIRGKMEIIDYIVSVISECDLQKELLNRYPHELSGGQLQRMSVARAIALKPDLIIADEVVSALDVAVQEQLLNLLMNLKFEKKVSMLFISHDLSVIKKISDNDMVMKNGKIIDRGSTDYIFHKSMCDYTKTLLEAIVYFPY